MLKKIISITLCGILACALGTSAFAATGAALPAVVSVGSEAEYAMISVGATHEVFVDPDIVYVTLGVNTTGANAEKARKENADLMNKVVAAVKKLGLKDDDIKTNNIYMSPTYDYSGKEPKLTGYQVSNGITLTVTDLTKLATIIDTAMSAGANNLTSVDFQRRNTDEIYNTALKTAIKKAKTKAEACAEAAGLTLAKISSISDSVVNSGYDYTRSSGVMADFAENSSAKLGLGETIQPGKIQVTVSVNVTYLAK